MAALQVDITGLVCHIADRNDGTRFTHSALVDEQTHHTAFIYVDGEDLIPRQMLPFTHYIKKFELITFESVGTGGVALGSAHSDAKFRTNVPSLTVVTGNGALDNDIINMRRDSNVLAYVKYPEGSLSVAAHFQMKAEYRLNDEVVIPIRCAAAITELVVEDNGRETDLVISKIPAGGGPAVEHKRVRVRSGAWVSISNATSHGGPRHFEHYKKLTDAENVAMVVKSTIDYCTDSIVVSTVDDLHHSLAGRSSGAARAVQFFKDVRSKQLAGTGILPKADPDPECSNTRYP